MSAVTGRERETYLLLKMVFFQEMDHHCIILLLLYFNIKETSVFNMHTVKSLSLMYLLNRCSISYYPSSVLTALTDSVQN